MLVVLFCMILYSITASMMVLVVCIEGIGSVSGPGSRQYSDRKGTPVLKLLRALIVVH